MPGDLLIEDTDPLSADNSVQQIDILEIDSVKKDAQRTDHPLEQSLAMQENLVFNLFNYIYIHMLT